RHGRPDAHQGCVRHVSRLDAGMRYERLDRLLGSWHPGRLALERPMSEDRDAPQVRAGIATVIGLAGLALALAAGASGTRGAPRAADSITRLGTGAWSWWLSSGPDWAGRRDQAQTWSPESESLAFL